MKSKFKYITLVAALTALIGCKKEPSSKILCPGSQTSYDCSLLFEKITCIAADTVFYNQARTIAFFLDSTVNTDYYGIFHSVSVGQVSVNGIGLRENFDNNSNSYDYYDSTNTIYSSPITINISGGNSYGAGSFSINEDYPMYFGYKYLPDTLHYSYNGYNEKIIIPISGYVGCDQVSAAVTVNPGLGPFTGSHPLEPGKQYALIDAYYLIVSPFGIGPAYLQINFSKTRYVKYGGKNYLLTFSHTYYRNVILAPH